MAASQKRMTDSKESLEETEYTKIDSVKLGEDIIQAPFRAPYPEEFHCISVLNICEFCLQYSYDQPTHHLDNCALRCPPGTEIYRKKPISFYEIDGIMSREYCINLCLLGKLFIKSKALFFEVQHCLFYVLTINDREGAHIVGYFSKIKDSYFNNHVSCILILPPYQKQGFGRLMIALSYHLTVLEGKTGTPEKPLSKMGKAAFSDFWKNALTEYFITSESSTVCIKKLSEKTGIIPSDIRSVLDDLPFVEKFDENSIVLKSKDIIQQYLPKKENYEENKLFDKECLRWDPHD